MTITEAAEQVLFGNSLEEKLKIAPINLSDSPTGKAISNLATPHRPSELKLSESGVRAQFPGVNTLDQDQSRGELLHFLANHELLASELMALVLLKFPEAPLEYRREVYEAMREEQMHTLMYIRRMKEAGLEFGQLPLNSYFWRLVSPMKSPMEFVTKLNLTFEQANLDFSYHYAKLFREVGDSSTATVLEKIYQDEIGHVGHGIHWLREWKDPKKSDWQAYSESLELPFSASKAKGLAPYNPEGRRKAGISEDFITKLSVYSQSRGRNPVLHWFNANAESSALAHHLGIDYHPSKQELAIEQDLEILMVAACKQDDMLLLRKLPSITHLSQLKEHGIIIPELVLSGEPSLTERKLGGLTPWAWSPDSSKKLSVLREQVPSSVPAQWQPALNPQNFSKQLGLDLKSNLKISSSSKIFTNFTEARNYLKNSPIDLRIKLPFACSGRGHYRYIHEDGLTTELEKFLSRAKKSQKAILIEPERNKVCDFSVHYDLTPQKSVKLRGFCVIENSPTGQFSQAHASSKWTSLLPKGIPSFLFRETDFEKLYYDRIPQVLKQLFPDYHGPISIDAMIYESNGLHLEPVVEVNARHTMGRLTLNLNKLASLLRPRKTLFLKATSRLQTYLKQKFYKLLYVCYRLK